MRGDLRPCRRAGRGSSSAALRPRYGTYASIGNHEYYRGIEQVRRAFDAGPIPLLIEGVHRPAVDPGLLGTRHVVRGSLQNVLRELRAYQSAGCSHVAVEVSYSTFPSILQTIDLLADEVIPSVR